MVRPVRPGVNAYTAYMSLTYTTASALEITTKAKTRLAPDIMSMSDEDGIEDEFSMDVDDYEDEDEIRYPSPAPGATAVPLKGRKRFLADLEELKKPSVIKLGSHGYALKSTISPDRLTHAAC